MKVLSRVASPAGFALVLLLFLVLPFVSVSCDVPAYGKAGVDYTGSHLVSGTDPTPVVPDALRELGNDPTAPAEFTGPAPDPGVQILAIVLAVLAAAGLLTVLIPQLKARMFGGAAAAGGALVVTILTMVIAQDNLRAGLLDGAEKTGATEQEGGMARMTSIMSEMVHTDLGFWLIVVVLALILVSTLGTAVLHGRPIKAAAVTELSGLPFEPRTDAPADEPAEEERH